MLKIKSPQDLGAGIFFAVIGIAGLVLGRPLAFGSSARMGPGYFPSILSVLIIGIGILVASRSFALEGPPIERPHYRPMLTIFAAILLFGFAMDYIGLALTTIGTVALAAFARRNVDLKETAILAIVLSLGCVLVFVYALGQAMPAWWGR